jgi:hypothetical protein
MATELKTQRLKLSDYTFFFRLAKRWKFAAEAIVTDKKQQTSK